MMNKPIGLFDSGVGGLSCVPAIKKLLPREQIIFYGDTARAPYGSRSADEITAFSLESAKLLTGKGCKLLSVGCNTISCVALGALREAFPDVPVVGIIEPAAKEITRLCSGKRVGLIGTEATVKSGAHEKALIACGFKGEYFAKACPDFVPCIEAGTADGEAFEAIVRLSLDSFVKDNALDVLVLGCTHFPFIRKHIEKLYPHLTVFDPAEALAAETKRVLEEKGLLAENSCGKDLYLASNEHETFKKFVSEIE